MAVKKATKKFIKKRSKAISKSSKPGSKGKDKKKKINYAKQIKPEASEAVNEEKQDSSSEDNIEEDFPDIEKNHHSSESESEEEIGDIENFHVDSDNDSMLDDEEHAKQLESLKEKDPKFYEFLLKNDASLLEYSPDEKENDASDCSEDENDIHQTNVSLETIQKWSNALQKNSLKSLKHMLLCLKSVASINDNEEGKNTQMITYKIEPGSKPSSIILLTTMKYAPIIFDSKLYGRSVSVDEKSKGLPCTHKKWKRIHILVKSFLTTLLKLMRQMTDFSVMSYILKASEESAAYFASFPKLGKEYVKELLQIWQYSDQEKLRIRAFLCLRKISMASPNPYLDIVLKGTYKSLLNSSRVTNGYKWASLMFMTNCIVELSGLHLQSTYQHLYVNLRHFAMQIRQSNAGNSKETIQSIYNWPFIWASRLNGRILSTYCNESSIGKDSEILRPLIYPFVQIIIGALRLKPSAKYFPFRIHLLNLMNEISAQTETYIPLASYVFEMFESSEFKGKMKSSTLKPLDFGLSIKCPSAYLGTRVYQNQILEESIGVLAEFYSTFSNSISFPEIATIAIQNLKKFVKNRKDFSTSKEIGGLLKVLAENSSVVEKRRNTVDYGPCDAKAKEFLKDEREKMPIYKYWKSRKEIEEKVVRDVAVFNDEDESEGESSSEVSCEGEDKGDYEVEEKGISGDDDVVSDFVLSDEER